ncbi:dihydrodipicolinate synthase family protein [Brenneria goodwinii]|uniref:Dihydrodipicolinate synthase family protein n=1 Tax=Brenneria goodwinii TaxID=1109412 RepID=A0AAE8ENB3_9GAMM|nr:dihydrodipicolinate synthase family protein [Brenneria goodwinii]ATA22689.1 dihydrodipicolinate synthase family protein [Brenneria goodwinii]RLM23279.1 dihydrodipicolinate synthase family protein [Brenneria goodwinii]
MSNVTKFSGVFPPVPTIVDELGQFDPAGMGKLIDKLIDAGVNGMLFLGSGGEFCHLTKRQRFEIAEFVTRYVDKRVPILLGISSTSTQEVIEYGKHADELGVDAVLVLNPYYALLNDDYIYHHFKSVASNIKSPIIAYNFPALTGQDISIPLLQRFASDIPNVIGVKDTVDNASHIREIINKVRPIREDFVIFAGFDEYMMDALILGANGGIPATCNFAPSITCGIYQCFKQKNYSEMFLLQRQLAKLSSVYSLETPFFGVIKEAIKLCGLDISTNVVPPVEPLSVEKRARLISILEFSGLVTHSAKQ